jgi:hypothetical protein
MNHLKLWTNNKFWHQLKNWWWKHFSWWMTNSVLAQGVMRGISGWKICTTCTVDDVQHQRTKMVWDRCRRLLLLLWSDSRDSTSHRHNQKTATWIVITVKTPSLASVTKLEFQMVVATPSPLRLWRCITSENLPRMLTQEQCSNNIRISDELVSEEVTIVTKSNEVCSWFLKREGGVRRLLYPWRCEHHVLFLRMLW